MEDATSSTSSSGTWAVLAAQVCSGHFAIHHFDHNQQYAEDQFRDRLATEEPTTNHLDIVYEAVEDSVQGIDIHHLHRKCSQLHWDDFLAALRGWEGLEVIKILGDHIYLK